jgi:hypothetical protein
MKKILLTATVLVGFATVAQAQQGRVGVNTTTPAATLDVAANTGDATRPDALLVPRMTRAQLTAKDAAYANTGTGATNQTGGLVFVTAIDGTASAKTTNVTTTGFYYYDGPNAVWVAVGGGVAATAARYETIRGNVTTVTTAAYTVAPTDNLIVTQFNNTVTITLPTLTNSAADIGRIVKVANNNTAASGLAFSGPLPTGANLTVNQGRGIEFIWTGTLWAVPQK